MFHKMLEHLEDAAKDFPKDRGLGGGKHRRIVRLDALRELLRHFHRLDAQAPRKALRYRVALFHDGRGYYWTDIAKDAIQSAAMSDDSETFVRWLTDWQEVEL